MLTTSTMVALTLVLALLAVVPTIWPGAVPGLFAARIDTDPENMLAEDEAVRVFHHRMKDLLDLYDIVVVGVVNEEHPEGVFNPGSLARIHELTEFARELRGAKIGADDPQAGVVGVDMIAPGLVDNIEQAGPGTVRFEWLMSEPPRTEEEARAIREKARRIPLLEGTMVSEDGKAIALYLPLTDKHLSHAVYKRLRERIAEMPGDEQYYITGLPVAEDTFGVEMFIQMGISAPLAMLVIFLLMLLFFRKLVLIVSPMIIALVSVIATMALLVVSGNTIHIMSSMIPIFIMPIAVLDSIHILSEFFDSYRRTHDRERTIREVVATLFKPMLFTSLTSAAGFASLALTPIPPVQIFGIFVAFGVLLAWFLTVTFIPAYVMFIPESSLENFGLAHDAGEDDRHLMSRLLRGLGGFTYRRAHVILAVSALAFVVAVVGITRIRINDNPTKWFRASHPIRQADRVLNEHFAGTYMAYLALSAPGASTVPESAPPEPMDTPEPDDEPGLPEGLGGEAEPSLPAGLGGTDVEEQAEPDVTAAAAAAGSTDADEPFKQPEVLRYVERLQAHLASLDVVGKSNSVADIVKTVHRELIDGSDEQFRIPDTPAAVAQSLLQYQSSHRPDDLWHFVTPDYRTTSLWVQLKSGDNRDMERVIDAVDGFVAENPPPAGLTTGWFGLTYINVIWQEKMVSGMMRAFLGSFVVVLIMMTAMFRSPLLGLLSMIPLTLTIGLIYGVIGFIGKDYDMPVAVLSALTLGLAVDFAIHFIARARELYASAGSWKEAVPLVFAEPARAITRNLVVIALGFTPLLAAPLVPYNTVGVFLAAILLVSGLATLMILPALMRIFEPTLFRRSRPAAAVTRAETRAG
jgi:predicted RND superfamily exporter protein